MSMWIDCCGVFYGVLLVIGRVIAGAIVRGFLGGVLHIEGQWHH